MQATKHHTYVYVPYLYSVATGDYTKTSVANQDYTSIVASVASGRPIPIPTTPVPPTPSCGGVNEWIQKTKSISNLLKKLGLKALDSLPGIIGGLLSWLLSTLSKAVGWLAEHVHIFVTGVGKMVLVYIQNQRKPNRKLTRLVHQ